MIWSASSRSSSLRSHNTKSWGFRGWGASGWVHLGMHSVCLMCNANAGLAFLIKSRDCNLSFSLQLHVNTGRAWGLMARKCKRPALVTDVFVLLSIPFAQLIVPRHRSTSISPLPYHVDGSCDGYTSVQQPPMLPRHVQ